MLFVQSHGRCGLGETRSVLLMLATNLLSPDRLGYKVTGRRRYTRGSLQLSRLRQGSAPENTITSQSWVAEACVEGNMRGLSDLRTCDSTDPRNIWADLCRRRYSVAMGGHHGLEGSRNGNTRRLILPYTCCPSGFSHSTIGFGRVPVLKDGLRYVCQQRGSFEICAKSAGPTLSYPMSWTLSWSCARIDAPGF